MRNVGVSTRSSLLFRKGIFAANNAGTGTLVVHDRVAGHLGTAASSLQRELESMVAADCFCAAKTVAASTTRRMSSPGIWRPAGFARKDGFGLVPALTAALKHTVIRLNWQCFMVPLLATKNTRQDVDLLIVGRLKQIDLLPALQKLETRFRREVNVTLYSPREFRGKLAKGTTFSVCPEG